MSTCLIPANWGCHGQFQLHSGRINNGADGAPEGGVGFGEDIQTVEVPTSASRSYAARRTGRFLKGPIPWSQIATATRLGGAALPLLLLVHHQIAVGAGPAVTLPPGRLAELGIDRRAKSRGLHVLEKAGLVRVARKRGRPALVALVPNSAT